jgi:hypothetical protein
MFKRVPQPPISPALRSREEHDFWAGFVVVFIGAALLLCGVRHLTAVETVAGGTAWETQLVKAYSSGGLEYPHLSAPPPPARSGDPAMDAAALDRWAKQNANYTPPSWKVRVDTSAKTPCPT